MKSKGCLLLDFPNSEYWCWSLPSCHSGPSRRFFPPAAALVIVRAPSSLASSSALGGLVWSITCLFWCGLWLRLTFSILPFSHIPSPFPFVSFAMTLSRCAAWLLPIFNCLLCCCVCCTSSSSAAERVLFVSNWVMPNENQISRNPAGNAGGLCLLFCTRNEARVYSTPHIHAYFNVV